MAEETGDRPRIIVGQVSLDDLIAVDLLPGVAAGRRHAGEQDAMLRPARLQAFDQGLGSARFPNRDGMHPDQLARHRLAVKTIALAKVVQILGLLAATPQQAQPDQRRDQVKQQRIEETRHQPSASCNSASTAAGVGI